MSRVRDRLAELACSAWDRLDRRYYSTNGVPTPPHTRLAEVIEDCTRTPIISEVKFQSPSAGRIREQSKVLDIAESMVAGGACALSILTDPDNFGGSLAFLSEASVLDVPLVMKDIIVSPEQLKAASRMGASAVVLISEIFTRGFAPLDLDDMLLECRKLGLEALVEANDSEEFGKIRKSEPDLYGINNRNLSTFQVDISTTGRILAEHSKIGRPVVSESGIKSAEDVRRLKAMGASAFLVGTSIMKSENVEAKVKELVNA